VRRTILAATVAVGLVAGAASSSLAAPATPDDLEVLVFSRTTEFRHLSIPAGIAAIESLGREHGFEVEATEDPAAFTDDNLARFGAVVFLNTTGTVLDDPGRAAFERYVRSGGAWVGVHSAADTEYGWDFYGVLLGGAYFHSHPVQQPGVLVVEDPDHPSTDHLPDPWALPFEEFYSFTANPRGRVRVLMTIDESTYLQDPNTTHIPRGPEMPEGESGVMGDDHPMSWCHDVGAGRAWYTALGHEPYLYALPDFRQHLADGILTAAGRVDADCSVPAADRQRGVGGTSTEGAGDDGPDAAGSPREEAGAQGASPGHHPGTGDPGPAQEATAAGGTLGTLPATGPSPATGLGLLSFLTAAAVAGRPRTPRGARPS
jgi:uncharacterized protein